MANVSILGGDVTVYFTDDIAGDKQIRWTGSAANTATRTVNELYSALEDLFDNVTLGAGDYMNEGVPMKGITPRAYDLGRIENNDPEPWFIDQTTIEHLTGGSIQTTGWTRTPGTTVGIVRVPVTASTITNADIGFAITHTDLDAGKLLFVEPGFLWIRPDSELAANNFDSVAGTLTCNGNTATQTAASTTGNNFWTNIFTVGTLFNPATTNIYIAQDGTALTSYWPPGHVDRLVLVKDQSNLYIDDGYLSVYAREENELYDNFVTQVQGSGRVTVPLATNTDLNDIAGIVTGVTVNTAGPYTADVDPDIGSPNENYSIQINCDAQPLQNVYSYLKQVTQSGSATTIAGLEGQQFVGNDHQIDYTAETNTVNIGDRVTGSVSGATATVVSVNRAATPPYVMIANTQGDFSLGENLVIGAASLDNITNIDRFSPTKAAPFGTFAGGRFFGSRGVYLTNIAGGEQNNYQTIDDDNNIIEEQIVVTYTVTNILPNTEIRIFTDPGLTEIAGVNEVGGAPDVNDNNLIVAGPVGGRYTASYSYVYSADQPIIIAALNTNYLVVRRSDTLTSSDKSIQINQIFDRQYI